MQRSVAGLQLAAPRIGMRPCLGRLGESREDIWRGPTQNGKYGRKRGEISEVFRVYSERGTRRMNYGLTLLYGFSRHLLGRRLGRPLEGGQPALKNNQTGYRGTSRRSQVSVTRLGGWEHA